MIHRSALNGTRGHTAHWRPRPQQWLFAPQISAAERERRDVLMLLLAVAFAVAPHFAHLHHWATFAFIVLWSWRFWLTLARRQPPGRALLLPLLVAATAAVALDFRTVLGRDAGVTLLLLLMALKLLEVRARRDVMVVICLALFVLLTQFLFDQGLAIAALALAAVIALVTVLISVNLTDGDLPGRMKLKLAATLALKALPLALVLFVFFPRLTQPLWGLPRDALASSGLSDSMTPGSISRLLQSDQIAFRVKFAGAAPPAASRYWRGPVFDTFDGRTWSSAARISRMRVLPVQVDTASAVDYAVTLEPSQRRWMFALDLPQVAPDDGRWPAHFSRDGLLTADTPLMQRSHYALRSYLKYSFDGQATEATLARFTELPQGSNPRTQRWATDLAADLRARGTDATAVVAATLEHFRRDGFAYSFEPPMLGRDAIDEFMFETRLGYCEHYAGAFVFVMRAAGIPARVVTGYQGGELNPVDDYMTLRQADAHAWAEIWLAQRGWVRIDPTAVVAPVRVEDGIAELARQAGLSFGFAAPAFDTPALLRWATRVRYHWEALQNAWNQRVLAYSSERQWALLDRLGLAPTWQMLGLLLGISFAGFLAVLGWMTLRAVDRRDPVTRLYEQFRQRLVGVGLRVDASLGPRGLMAQLREEPEDAPGRRPVRALTPAAQQDALQLLREFERLRYSPDAATINQRQVGALRKAVRGFRPTLA